MRPDKTQLIKTLWGEKGEYVPLMELGIHPSVKDAILGRPVRSLEDDVAFWATAGYDFIKLQPEADFHVPGYISDESITASLTWAPETRGIIHDWADFEAFPFLKPNEINYGKFDRVRSLLPEGMGIIGQYGDIFTMSWELMGFETFSLALFENPDLVAAVVDRIGSTVLSMFETMVDYEDVIALWYSDDIAYSTGLMISPVDLEKYFFPWLEKIGTLAKARNKPFIYHSDGVLWDVLPELRECGINALHPIEPRAMDIIEVREKVGRTLCLVGNIDVGEILSRGTPEDVCRAVRRTIESVGQEGAYCCGSSNSIPDYVCLENYRAMIDAVRSHSL
ncbi:MAG: uroporphyrinogen decarboxylase family protein [Fidelibacterota bacterium]